MAEPVIGAGPSLGVAVVIPALNEEASLPFVLRGLRDAGVDRVVVVDNGSTDGTARAAADEGAEVVHALRRGYGRACLAGIARLAAGTPPEVVVFMDGDGSDDLDALRSLLDPVVRGAADLVIGVRTGGIGATSPVHARLGTRAVLTGARALHGIRARDLGPFRVVSWGLLERLRMDDRTWGWTLQMQLRAHHLGARILEVDVRSLERRAGRSKVSGSLAVSLRAGFRMGYTLIRERLLRRRFRREARGAPLLRSPRAGSPEEGARES